MKPTKQSCGLRMVHGYISFFHGRSFAKIRFLRKTQVEVGREVLESISDMSYCARRLIAGKLSGSEIWKRGGTRFYC